MRVAVFTDNDFGKMTGVTTTLRAVSQHAVEPFRPRVYTAADGGEDLPDYFSIPSLGVRLPWYQEIRIYWPRMRAFARELRRDGTQLIHVTTPGPVGLAGRYLARRLQLPMVGSFHTHLGEYIETLSGSSRLARLMDHYMRWVYGACQTVLVPSEATRTLLSRTGLPADRLRVWPRGVDAAQFSPDRASQSLRRQWGVDRRRPAILYAGRLSAEKGLGLVTAIQRRLHRHGVAHRLIFAGDGPMAPSLKEACPDAVFLGRLPHEQVAVAMASADVFLFPSATDAFGNVVLEAQASGLPVLVSDRGGPQEHVEHGATGYVCRAGDADAFSDRLILLLRSHDHRQALGAEARRRAQTRTWPVALQPLFEAWRDAAGRPTVTAPVTLRLAPVETDGGAL